MLSSSEIAAMDLARAAALELELDGAYATLLRVRASTLVVLPRAQVVARVESRSRRALARQQVQLARAFARCDSPTVRLVRPERQPVMFDEGAVTLWQWLEAKPGAYCDPHTLGELTRAIHETARPLLSDAEPDELPTLNPFESMDTRLELLREDGYDPGQVRALAEHRAELERSWMSERLQDPLGLVLLHGDVHHQNVVMAAAGPVFVDLEDGGVGPASWDFAAQGAGVRRYGTELSAFEDFVAGYGADPRDWSGFELLCECYELVCTVWAAHCRRQSPQMADEARLRVCAILDGGSLADAPRWTLL